MIGFVTLIDAEDVARDLVGGESWPENPALTPVDKKPGLFLFVADYEITGGGGIMGQILYQDLPFGILSESSPGRYLIDRKDGEFDGTTSGYYQLTESSRASFDQKRRLLFEAFRRLVALEGYEITPETEPEPDLVRAQVQAAIDMYNDVTGARALDRLAGAGVKRDRRGKAETEFFAAGERDGGRNGLSREVLNWIEKYRTVEEYGVVLSPV